MATTYLEAIRAGSLGRDGARPERLPASARTSASTAARSRSRPGFLDRFGERRVVDTPISESAIVGAAIGASLMGLRPVAEMQFADFISCALRPDRELRRQVPLPLGRAGAHRGARAFGRRHPRRAVPFAESRGVVRAHAGPEGGGAGHRLRRQGPDQVRHPRQRPGAVLRAQGALPAHQGRPARGRLHGADRQGAGGARGQGPDHHHLRRDGLHVALEAAETAGRRGRFGGGGRPAHAAAARRGDRAGERAEDVQGDRCCTRTPARAASAARSPPSSPRRRSNTWTAPIVRVTAPDTPVPFSPPLEEAFLPNAAKVLDGARKLLAY